MLSHRSRVVSARRKESFLRRKTGFPQRLTAPLPRSLQYLNTQAFTRHTNALVLDPRDLGSVGGTLAVWGETKQGNGMQVCLSVCLSCLPACRYICLVCVFVLPLRVAGGAAVGWCVCWTRKKESPQNAAGTALWPPISCRRATGLADSLLSRIRRYVRSRWCCSKWRFYHGQFTCGRCERRDRRAACLPEFRSSDKPGWHLLWTGRQVYGRLCEV